MDETSYLDALQNVLENGELRITRNANTYSLFGVKIEIDISKSYPLLTTKKMFTKGIIEELLWFISGNTNSKKLEEKGVNIWKGNSCREYLDSVGLNYYEDGDCGPCYSHQWRHFNAPYINCYQNYNGLGIDQLQNCIDLIKNNPTSRRIFMSAWNPCQLNEMVLLPCHISYQFYVSNDNKLSCILYQRSGDMFLGIPFNIASVSLLVYIIALITDKTPGKVTLMIGDAHIYENHITQVKIQLNRTPYIFPQLVIKKKYENINDYKYDFEIINYNSHGILKANMVA